MKESSQISPEELFNRYFDRGNGQQYERFLQRLREVPDRPQFFDRFHEHKAELGHVMEGIFDGLTLTYLERESQRPEFMNQFPDMQFLDRTSMQRIYRAMYPDRIVTKDNSLEFGIFGLTPFELAAITPDGTLRALIKCKLAKFPPDNLGAQLSKAPRNITTKLPFEFDNLTLRIDQEDPPKICLAIPSSIEVQERYAQYIASQKSKIVGLITIPIPSQTQLIRETAIGMMAEL